MTQHAERIANDLEVMGLKRDVTKVGNQCSWFTGLDFRTAKAIVRRYQKVFSVAPTAFNVSGGIVGLTH
jgi:hypothetical protein